MLWNLPPPTSCCGPPFTSTSSGTSPTQTSSTANVAHSPLFEGHEVGFRVDTTVPRNTGSPLAGTAAIASSMLDSLAHDASAGADARDAKGEDKRQPRQGQHDGALHRSAKLATRSTRR